jgi:hypothetical protein
VSADPTLAPFPWMGGKSGAARLAWAAMGADVPCFVEPFMGSAAVLLARPGDARGTETANDADGMVANFWRAVAADPEAVARHADWPVSEVDLTARHLWLVGQRASLTERLQVDPCFFDARAAGWWCWGACSWIGSGWCSGEGPWATDGERWIDLRQLPHLGNAGRGINRKLPHLGNAGRGINRKLPHLGNAGQGINRQLPHLGDAGQGINRKLPHLGDAGQGILGWMEALRDRLRGVRVACGSWERVVTPAVTTRHGTTGVFLDPPYPAGWDTERAYSAGTPGSMTWHEAARWAVEAGEDRALRIVLCGYAGTWAAPRGWREVPWKARGGYASGGEDGDANSRRERLWLSPGCLDIDETRGVQAPLFGGAS